MVFGATRRAGAMVVTIPQFFDVVREAQEIVELALKGMLRQVGVEPPKWHDVGGVPKEYATGMSEQNQCEVWYGIY